MSDSATSGSESESAEAGASETAPPRLSTRRKLLFGAVLLLILFGVAEVGLRVAYFLYRGSWNFVGTTDISQGLYYAHPYTCFALKPNAAIETYLSEVHTNRWGNRGPEQPYEKPPGTVRIVCLGGSTTFCIYASDDAHTWASRLEAKLNEHYAPHRFEVINYSSPGYNSAESLTTFALRALDRDPDVVIVHHGWNDLTAAAMPGLVSDYTHRREAGSVSRQPWYAESAVYRLAVVLKHRCGRVRAPEGTLEGISQRARDIYERNIESIVLLAKPRGIEPVLVTLASRLPPDDEADTLETVPDVRPPILAQWFTPAGLYRAVGALNDAMRRVARRRDVLLVDLANTYPREKGMFKDFGHKSDEGLEVFADLLLEAMVENGVIDRVLARRQHAAADEPSPSS